MGEGRRTPRGGRMKRRTFLAAAATLLAPRVAWADAVDDALARIAKAREGTTSLRATFTQKRVIHLMDTATESRGRVAVVRPDRPRRDLEPQIGRAPCRERVLADGAHIRDRRRAQHRCR